MLGKWNVLGGLFAAATVALVGCDKDQPRERPPGPAPAVAPTKPADEHAHKPGAHGGILVSLGRDSYHAEAVFTAKGVIKLYTLGKDEARIQEVEAQELVGYVTATGSAEPAAEVKFSAEPQPGDAPGRTSLFVGQLPPALAGKEVQVTVNNIRFGAERFRIAFSNAGASRHDEAMPAGVTSDDARKLYLTPGGRYTASDVRANGGTTPSAKFRGVKSDHNAKPQPGDKICPVSMTKANGKFTWVVDGKAYEFCCVPCIDEFVQAAKDNPGALKDPSEYVKK